MFSNGFCRHAKPPADDEIVTDGLTPVKRKDIYFRLLREREDCAGEHLNPEGRYIIENPFVRRFRRWTQI